MKFVRYKKLLIAGFAIITFLGIFLPGILLHTTFSAKLDSVNTISPDLYTTSNSAISRNASQKLSEYDRIKMISSVWSSIMTEADPAQLNISEVEAVDLARAAVGKLNDLGAYPYRFDSSYDNWYSWEAHCYRFTEVSFNTYSAYCWKITFYRYDTDEIHEILLTENGTLLAIKNNQSQDTITGLSSSWHILMENYFNELYPDTPFTLLKNVDLSYREYMNLEYDTDSISSPSILHDLLIVNDTGITTEDDIKKLKQPSKDMEIYHVIRINGDTDFLMFIIPWENGD